MTIDIRPLGAALALATAAIVGGCASTPATTSPETTSRTAAPLYYPPPPAPPRLQFLTSFSDATAWSSARAKKSSFGDWVAGAGTEASSSSRFDSPYGIDARDGKLYICDVSLNKVHVIDMRQRRYRELGGKLRNPVNVTIDADDKKYVCDTERRSVMVYDASDNFIDELGAGMTWTPIDVAILGDELFIADVTGGVIHVMSKSGSAIRTIGKKGRGPDELNGPTNLAFGPDQKLYVTDTLEQIVKVFNLQGQYVGAVGGPGGNVGRFARPKGIAADDAGIIFVADAQWDVVQMFNPEGQVLLAFGKPGTDAHGMGMPAGLAIDATSRSDFKQFIAPNFDAQYLLFVVNQFGKNKIAVYAYGRDRTATYDD